MPPFLLPQTFYEPIISAPLHRTMIKTICRDVREIVGDGVPYVPQNSCMVQMNMY